MRSRCFLSAVVLAAVSVAGCAMNGQPKVITGEWGGDHIQLTAGSDSSRIEYDCAFGSITGPIAVDTDARLHATGTHIIGHGGPIRNDEVPDAHPARYSGFVNGPRMTLTVVLADRGDTVGTFTLKRGVVGRVFRCL